MLCSLAAVSRRARRRTQRARAAGHGGGGVVGLAWTLKDYDAWPDLFPVLPFAAVGVGGVFALAERHLSRRTAGVVAAAFSVAAVVLALVFSLSMRDDTLDVQRHDIDAVLAQLPKGATITSIEAPQPLVLTGRTNPTRYQMFRGGLQDYMDDTWPGGLDGFKRDLVAQHPDLIAVGETVSHRWRASIEPDYVYIGSAPVWGWYARPRSVRRRSPRCARPRTSTRATRWPGRRSPPHDADQPPGDGARARLGRERAAGLRAVRDDHRGLGAGAAAPVSVLWTQWAFAGAAFTFPLQHWITRSVGAGHEGDVRRAAGRVSLLVLVAALLLGVLVLAGPRPAVPPRRRVVPGDGRPGDARLRGGRGGARRARWPGPVRGGGVEPGRRERPALPARRRAPAAGRARPGGARALPGGRVARGRAVAGRAAVHGRAARGSRARSRSSAAPPPAS